MPQFQDLAEVAFSNQMRPYADAAYSTAFPGSRARSLTATDLADGLDRWHGVDRLLVMHHMTRMTVQEKFRRPSALQYEDVTFEVANGDGTPGEWHYGKAQLRFVGWANEAEDGWARWHLYDECRVRIEIERAGGLGVFGKPIQNRRCGRSFFVGVPFVVLAPALVALSPAG